MKELKLVEGCIKFPKELPYVDEYYTNSNKLNLSYRAIKWLFMWSTLADKYKEDKVYQKNFYTSLKTELNKEQKNLKFPIDFENTLNEMYLIKQKYAEEKKEYNKEHRKEIAEENKKWKEEYGYAFVDGEKVEIGNSLIESSRIFIGRGDCSWRGFIVEDVMAEDISINSSYPFPCNYPTHNWKEVSFKDTMSIATYTEHLVGNKDVTIQKAIWFSNKSSFKADSDEEKFENARLLQVNIKKVTKAIKDAFLSDDVKTRQIGCCAYIISKFGIRAGNEDKRNNGVVGASTLKVENIELYADKQQVHLKFLGKDSMMYDNTLKVDTDVLLPLWKCIDGKNCKEQIFDRITSHEVNEFLNGICKDIPHLTGKLFRTTFGTSLLAEEIQKRDWNNLTDKQFKNQYMDCAKVVTIKLNHKKTLTKEQNEKIDESTKKKIKSAKDSFEKTKSSVEKKLSKLEGLENDYKSCLDGKILKDKLAEIKEQKNQLKEKLNNAEQKFKDTKKLVKANSENRDIALNTAMTSYSSPKVAYSLCKDTNHEPTTIYSKALVERFNVWASDTPTDYWRKYPNV